MPELLLITRMLESDHTSVDMFTLELTKQGYILNSYIPIVVPVSSLLGLSRLRGCSREIAYTAPWLYITCSSADPWDAIIPPASQKMLS